MKNYIRARSLQNFVNEKVGCIKKQTIHTAQDLFSQPDIVH